jgi:hypothetical protein
MKRITFALIIGFAFALPNIGSAQESLEPGFAEPTLRKMYCSSQKTSYACKYLSEGEDCPLSHTTTCN